ncbi:Dedicator of cytokinesis protein 9 [Lamellibrachia satsuma]|nr:Dedicator of cytokinesis protein 9 [Lamellibrachia satsuma]
MVSVEYDQCRVLSVSSTVSVKYGQRRVLSVLGTVSVGHCQCRVMSVSSTVSSTVSVEYSQCRVQSVSSTINVEYSQCRVQFQSCHAKFRTTRCSVPPNAPEVATGLLVKESIQSYTSIWHAIHYKYSAYSGSYKDLPGAYSGSYKDLPGGKPPDVLPHQVFEVDTEDNDEESSQRNGAQQITKQGWLYKGPDNGLETSIMSFTRSFKRRYFYLKQQADMTYMMEFFKDERKLDPKGSIFMDSAVNVDKSSRRGKHAFQLHMQNKSFYLFAAETEGEMDSWVTTLNKVIQSNDSICTPSLDRLREKDYESSPVKGSNLQESLEHSMNPELQKYARETDNILASRRKEARQKLFSIYPQIQRGLLSPGGSNEAEMDVYQEQFGTRFVVECQEFQLRLQVNLAEDGKPQQLNNPEPFFITLSLYDAREGKKISEDFHFDPNKERIRLMIPNELLNATDMLNSVNGATSGEPDLYGVDSKWLAYCDRAIFTVARPHHEIFLVARIEKVLQGGINAAVEPYIRSPDEKLGTKIHRQMALYCSKLGHYRMPFAWGARPVFQQKAPDELDTNAGFALYKTERTKLGEEEIIRHLQDIKKPEKQGKWQSIHGSLMVRLKPFRDTLPNTLTSSLVPVAPFPAPPSGCPTIEVEEFTLEQPELASPFTTYVNHLYVSPRNLKYDCQKVFAKARNIACYVEIRDSDTKGAVPLKCIRGRPGSSLFTTSATTAVLHHDSTPDFIEEVKACLPTQLHDRHHLVFTFSHVSCDLSKTTGVKGSTKKAMNLDAVIGYAWLPLLTNGRVNVGDQAVRVAINLPPGYLQHEQLGLGKGNVGPDVRWVDSGRPLFKFNLGLVSTIYTKDQHLHNFFAHCQKMMSQPSLAADFETNNKLKHDPATTSPPSSPVIADLAAYNRDMLKYVKVSF